MSSHRSEPSPSSHCASGMLCFLHRYKHLNHEVHPGQHATPEAADRCERRAGVAKSSH